MTEDDKKLVEAARSGKVTISNLANYICNEICNKYCKYPDMFKDKPDDWLLESPDSPCQTCPLDFL